MRRSHHIFPNLDTHCLSILKSLSIVAISFALGGVSVKLARFLYVIAKGVITDGRQGPHEPVPRDRFLPH